MTEPAEKPLRNRKGKQVYAGIGALTAGFAFVVYVGGDNATYVTFATAICALCGVGIWGNVREHEAPAKTNGNVQAQPPASGQPSNE
jgi:hypothetical protein